MEKRLTPLLSQFISTDLNDSDLPRLKEYINGLEEMEKLALEVYIEKY